MDDFKFCVVFCEKFSFFGIFCILYKIVKLLCNFLLLRCGLSSEKYMILLYEFKWFEGKCFGKRKKIINCWIRILRDGKDFWDYVV